MHRYRLFDRDGEDVGEIHLASAVDVDDEVFLGRGYKLRVVSLIRSPDDDGRVHGLLMVEPARAPRIV